MNPYFDATFFSFFLTLASRLIAFCLGQLSFSELAPDEIQLLVLGSTGISGALVGTFLVFRKMTMLANSLSHTILLGIVIAFFAASSATALHEGQLNLPLLVMAAIFVGLLTTFVTQSLTHFAKLQEDASTGLVFTSFFALGIVLVNLLTRNAHIGAEVVMGNVDALHRNDIYLAFLILAFNLGGIAFFFRGWKVTTFDPAFSKAMGFSPPLFNYLLMSLVSLTVVGAFRAVGVLMVLTFITAPPLFARLFSKTLLQVLVRSSGIALLASFIGVALARHLLTHYGIALSTAGIVVTLMGGAYLIAALIKKSISTRNKKLFLGSGEGLHSKFPF